jgi:hypothetical protein
MTIEPAQVDGLSAAAGGAADVQVPMLSTDGGADRRREQQRGPLHLALVPFGHESERVDPHLGIESAPCRSLFLGLAPSLVLKFALIVAHSPSSFMAAT